MEQALLIGIGVEQWRIGDGSLAADPYSILQPQATIGQPYFPSSPFHLLRPLYLLPPLCPLHHGHVSLSHKRHEPNHPWTSYLHWRLRSPQKETSLRTRTPRGGDDERFIEPVGHDRFLHGILLIDAV